MAVIHNLLWWGKSYVVMVVEGHGKALGLAGAN